MRVEHFARFPNMRFQHQKVAIRVKSSRDFTTISFEIFVLWWSDPVSVARRNRSLIATLELPVSSCENVGLQYEMPKSLGYARVLEVFDENSKVDRRRARPCGLGVRGRSRN